MDSSPVTNTPQPSYHLLFGGQIGWKAEDWTDSDDRVRGGSSQSYLKVYNDPEYSHAVFTGNLDTTTLGGAGFASQRTTSDDRRWDLSSYHGIALNYDVAASDDKVYTFILKDNLLSPDPSTGREQSTLSWEYDFRPADLEAEDAPTLDSQPEGSDLKLIAIPWDKFKPTYRGREVADPEPLQTDRVKRVSIMMRSFFDTQSGPFKLDLVSIAAFSSPVETVSEKSTVTSTVENDSESTISTLVGEEKDRKDEGPKQSSENEKTTAQRGFWSRLACC